MESGGVCFRIGYRRWFFFSFSYLCLVLFGFFPPPFWLLCYWLVWLSVKWQIPASCGAVAIVANRQWLGGVATSGYLLFRGNCISVKKTKVYRFAYCNGELL
jgi:hypothetical protein